MALSFQVLASSHSMPLKHVANFMFAKNNDNDDALFKHINYLLLPSGGPSLAAIVAIIANTKR